MAKKYPKNIAAEQRLIASLIAAPDKIPVAIALGLDPSDFWPQSGLGVVWEALRSLWRDGSSINVVTLDSELQRLGVERYDIEEIAAHEKDPDAVADFARLVIEASLRRQYMTLARSLFDGAGNQDSRLMGLYRSHMHELDNIAVRMQRLENPRVGNPAEELRRAKTWSVATGIPPIDRRIRWTSGGIHFVAGDPGSGKTTIAITAASNIARSGTNVVLILAESQPIEAQLSMLTGLGKVDSATVNRIRFDPNWRTEDNIKIIEELWNESFEDVPLSIINVTGGPDDAIAISNATVIPSAIIVDHAYALVHQAKTSGYDKEHVRFIRMFAGLLQAAQRGNHIMVVLNQFTKAGRSTENRGADAEYGGSGVRNIADSMLHLWTPDADVTYGKYKLVQARFVKARTMLVVDEAGRPVDPTAEEFSFYIDTAYRRIVESTKGEM